MKERPPTNCGRNASIVNGGEKMGQWGGAKVYHQGLLASINVRTNCSGKCPTELVAQYPQISTPTKTKLSNGRTRLLRSFE